MAPSKCSPRLPPPITEKSSVLVSHIPLPPLPSITYAKFIPAQGQEEPCKAVEHARQRIVDSVRRCGCTIPTSLLPIVHVGKEEVALWVFSIRSEANAHEHGSYGKGKEKEDILIMEELDTLVFDGLERCNLSRFSPSSLYPCCTDCSKRVNPCPSCTCVPGSSTPADGISGCSSSATLFPRIPLRPVYALFIDAVRERLIDDICIASSRRGESKWDATRSNIPLSRFASGATRFGSGFLLDSDHMVPMWGCGWDRQVHRRYLIHTTIDVYLSPTALHIRPLPTLTRLLPIPVWCSLPSSRSAKLNLPSDTTFTSPPLTPGTPLLLAPYPTPAFYVSTLAGTSIPHSVRAQFRDALTGLGASNFPPQPGINDSPGLLFSQPLMSSGSKVCAPNIPAEPFVLAFIPLNNPQGEPKGVTALWPARLAFIDTSPTRVHLTKLPEMPGTEVLLTPPRNSGVQAPSQAFSPSLTAPVIRRRPLIRGTRERLNRAQRVFRTLELSSNRRIPGVSLRGAAKNTAGYVDTVAKEREKERERANQERIRREREAKECKPSSSGTLQQSTGNAQTTQNNSNATGLTPTSPKVMADTIHPTSSWRSIPTAFFAKAAQDNVVHSFYPSPPDWNPVVPTQNPGSTEQSAPLAASSYKTGIPPNSTSPSQSGTNVTHHTSIDLSNGIDLGMDIDIDDMGMGINLGDTVGILGVNMDAGGLLDSGFGNFSDAFTDDDFNYFDAPPPEPIPVIVPDNQPPLHSPDPDESAVDGWLANRLGGANQRDDAAVRRELQAVSSAGIHASSRDSLLRQPLGDLHMSVDDRELLPPAPDLVPSSPAKTPWSIPSPPTPSLELNFLPPASAAGKRMFEPIKFGNRHHTADGKYRDAAGKFAFPNTMPRIHPQSDFVIRSPYASDPEKEYGWKLRYDEITDPRIGVINRLRRVKRNLQGSARALQSMDGRLRDEEWERLYDRIGDDDLHEDTTSSEEEQDIEELVLEPDQDDNHSTSHSPPSRPNTPPSPGLPLGPTLLYFRLHHSYLLPLSIPVRPPYRELVSNDDPHPAPLSVPTPVSPAAALGGATERSKTLELLAQAVAKEAVDNHIWAQAWGSFLEGPPNSSRVRLEVSQVDLAHVADLMGTVMDSKGWSSLASLLEDSLPTIPALEPHTPTAGNNLHMLQPPRFSIGRAGLVQYMLPSAIRFWEKEGLGPRGGTKNIVAFALFEEGDERSSQVETWMERVGRAYSARGFGTHTSGNAGAFERGLVPLQFETIRKTLPALISVLPPELPYIVLYVIAPPAIYSSLKSSALRAIIMNQSRVSRLGGQHDFDQDRILIHFVPDHHIADPFTYPNTRHLGLEWFVNSVYDRLLRVTLRHTSRQFWEYNPPFEHRFQVPAFTLARNTAPHTHLEWDDHPSLNVLDRYTFLHVGYCLSRCKRWLLAACIDERGEAHDVGVWGVSNHSDSQALNLTSVVSNVWIFINQFAQRVDTEWRIVVSKLGEIGETEVEVWMSHLQTVVPAYTGPPLHVSLVCAQSDIPFPFLPSANGPDEIPANVMAKTGMVYTDVSSVTYSVTFPRRAPIISSSLMCPCDHPSLLAPMGSTAEEIETQSAVRLPGPILPLSTTALLRVPNESDYTYVEALHIHLLYEYKSDKSTMTKTTQEVHEDITRSWHDLTVLTRERWHFPQQEQLPFHLAALDLMSSVLDPEVLGLDENVQGNNYLGN